MTRVVRPGGRIVALEPDWDTIVLSGRDLETTRAVARACARQIRHPDAGPRLPEWFVGAGVEVIRVDALAIPVRSVAMADHAYALTRAVQSLDMAAAHAWFDDLRAQERR